jgi:hypothetical protein
VDGEDMLFTNSNFGSSAPNFARMSIGDWTYMVYGMIDQNDGIYRHDFATAGGKLYALPSGGSASYQGSFGGVVEKYDSTNSYAYPIIGDGIYTADFGTGGSSIQIVIDQSRSNGVSGVINGYSASSSFANNGYNGFANSNISTPTGTGYVEGNYAGFVAGPSGEETAGTVQLQSLSGSPVVFSVVGGYRGE